MKSATPMKSLLTSVLFVHLEYQEKPLYTSTVINLQYIQALCKQGKIRWTHHITARLPQRGIKQADVENAILTGCINRKLPR